ncbi:MAG: hypothetical protein N3I35_13760, partial [Clostridia bacterium]|nr:hypothetical protein [Clostridia bacterium]
MRYIPKVALTVFLAITVVVSIFSFSYAGDVTEDFETWGFSNGTSASPEYVHNGWKFQSFYLGASATPSAIKLVTSPAALSLSDGAPVDELRIIKINELGNNVRFIFKGFYFTRTTLAPRKLKVTGWRNGAQVTGEIYYDYDDSTPDNTYCNVISDTGFQNVDEVRIAADEDVTEYNNNNVIDTVRKLDLYFEDFVYDATPVSSTAPILGNISGDSASYIEDSPHALLDAGTPAALTDADSTNMNGGKVTVEISSNRVPGEDVLCIQNQGAGSGQIGVSGSNVTYEGTTIGTYSGGTGVNNLVVSLNTSSSPAAIQSLIRALTYSNSNNANPDTSQRTISVTVDDGGGGISGTANVTVDVTRANDAPADIGLSNSSVPESAISGSTVGILSSTDVDIGDTTFTYALVSGAGDTDNASFAIDGTALETAAGFNYEAKNSYSIRVRATDAGGLWYEKQLTIAITNVNENPTGITLTNSTIAENSATGSAIGTFSSTDTDVIDTFTYALVSGAGDADNASFTIDGNILKTNTTFSYAAKNSYSIRVRTTDAGGLTYERQFTISISEVNAAPSDIAISSSSIAENSPSESAVGSLSTTDSNSGDVLFTYALVSGAGDTDNASFAIDGTALETAAGFNYEAKNSYSIRVRATDAGGLWYEKQFTITITNVNETPTDITLSNNSIAENTASGSSVGTLAGIDPDAGSSFTYALVSGAGDTDNASFA